MNSQHEGPKVSLDFRCKGSSSLVILSNFFPNTSTNCGRTERGDALATTVGKQSLRSWWFRLFSPKLWSNALVVSRRNLLRSKKQSSLKLITPAALAIPPSGAACWPEELPLTWWSNKASWEALMFGRSESKRDPPLSWPNDVRIKGVLNGFWSSTSVNA